VRPLSLTGHRVLDVRDFSDSVFVMRLERQGLAFRPGQHVLLGLRGSAERREYTVYSPPRANYLELLIKDIDGGDVSERLHLCESGERLELQGPFGEFTIPDGCLGARFLFVATGTGISPFHCFVESYRNLDYRVLHGVRRPEQLYGRESFDPERHVDCLSRCHNGRFRGRVTDYLRANPVDPATYCYLCGSADMIYETFQILRGHGVPRDHLYTEVYF
jgi:ferredoxin--NADP+ reductase